MKKLILATWQEIKASVARRFPQHDWRYEYFNGVEYRTCTCCGRCEERDYGHWFGFWAVVERGNYYHINKGEEHDFV